MNTYSQYDSTMDFVVPLKGLFLGIYQKMVYLGKQHGFNVEYMAISGSLAAHMATLGFKKYNDIDTVWKITPINYLNKNDTYAMFNTLQNGVVQVVCDKYKNNFGNNINLDSDAKIKEMVKNIILFGKNIQIL